jgi:hypothetical protein
MVRHKLVDIDFAGRNPLNGRSHALVRPRDVVDCQLLSALCERSLDEPPDVNSTAPSISAQERGT